MKQINIALLRSFKPCYDPNRYLSEDWTGTALDFLNIKEIPFHDRLWVLMRTDFVSEKLLRLFAVWCARQVQHLMKDERSLKALDVAEAFANGAASQEELDAAWTAAWTAARVAAWAAWDAARAAGAAWAAAGDAAWDAQENKLREMLIEGEKTGDVK